MNIRRVMGSAALLLAAAMCLAGCSDAPEGPESSYGYTEETTEEPEMITLSGDDVSSIVDAVPELPETADPTEAAAVQNPSEGTTQPSGTVSPFGKSIYLGRATDWTERFFCFTDGADGSFYLQENGAATAFTLTMDGSERIMFHMGEKTMSADLFWMDDTNVMLLWEDGVSETLTKIGDDPAGFKFYSSEALCNKALDVYAQKNGTRPARADAVLNADDTISVKLYDEVDGHSATCDWYTVNRYTGLGTNMLGDPVDLSDGTVPPAAAETTAQPTETQPAATQPTETQPAT